MKVAHVGNLGATSSNGVHQAVSRIANLLLRAGHEVEVWHLSRRVSSVERREVEGISVIDLPVHAAPGAAGSHVQIPTQESRRVLRELAQDADVVHLHSVFQPDHTWTASLGRPFILTPHGGYHPLVMAGSHRLLKRSWLLAQDRRLLTRAAAVQVLSTRERDNVIALQGRASVQILPVPLGPAAARVELDGVNRDFLFVGRLDAQHKGLDLLLLAWAGIPSSDRRGRRLVLAGPAHPGAESVVPNLVDELGLTDVDMPGPLYGADKAKAMSRAAWFLHPSRREGLPLSPLEAAAHGLPLIVSDQTNLEAAVLRNDCGFVCSPEIASVQDALCRALALSDEEHTRMAQRCPDLVHDFTVEALTQPYLDMYQRAAGDG